MGIRFNCPGGHRLHVKEFLAGKTGICPKCGAKVEIPLESQLLETEGHAIEPHPAGRPSGPARRPTKLPLEPLPAEAGAAADAVWFVQIESGEQFGPATWDLFREWVDQGRVGDDCYVWQTGWPEWRKAASVLQSLKASNPAETDRPKLASAPPGPTEPDPTQVGPGKPAAVTPPDGVRIETDRPLRVNRRKSRAVLYLLMAACGALLIPLVYVLTRT